MRNVTWCITLIVGLSAASCGNVDSFKNLLDLGVCNPSQVDFSTDIDNTYFPLQVGDEWVLEGEEDGQQLYVRIRVLNDVETVSGVRTRVVEEYEVEDGKVIEISRNFFAQAEDGTVCYFGEDVDIYDENGDIKSHDGAWRAENGNLPGIYMPAAPAVGQAYNQENAPGIAEDQAKVIALGETVTVPFGTFSDTVRMIDQNLLDGDKGKKIYARGIGIIVDNTIELTSYR